MKACLVSCACENSKASISVRNEDGFNRNYLAARTQRPGSRTWSIGLTGGGAQTPSGMRSAPSRPRRQSGRATGGHDFGQLPSLHRGGQAALSKKFRRRASPGDAHPRAGSRLGSCPPCRRKGHKGLPGDGRPGIGSLSRRMHPGAGGLLPFRRTHTGRIRPPCASSPATQGTPLQPMAPLPPSSSLN
jgi:hypothetical protein